MAQAKVRPKTLEEGVGFSMGNEIRFETLSILNERVASPNEVAREIGASLSKVSHHITTLVEMQCIELVRIEPRGGSAEHFYRAVKRPELSDEEWRELPPKRRRRILASVFRNLIAEILSALRIGKMDSDDYLQASWTAANLDAQARAEVAQEQVESMDRLKVIVEKAATRMASSGESGISTVFATIGFKRSRIVQTETPVVQ
jgi:DNA-binding transcriptional ArsR family regulator